jgi:hypothetical protein
LANCSEVTNVPMPAAARTAVAILDCRTTPVPLAAYTRIGGMVMNATTGINGNRNQKTQRQPIWSVIVPAIAGARRLGNTQPADRYAYIPACRSSGNARLTST